MCVSVSVRVCLCRLVCVCACMYTCINLRTPILLSENLSKVQQILNHIYVYTLSESVIVRPRWLSYCIQMRPQNRIGITDKV